ncbi:hypothetical protein ACIA8O_13910 [Kitasatospora sp. NPDC051853]|uniref:hypothetical protein n=1 Tax=Kitasatospora sp. NPDC051853 TaxID=3364058 RepID=UPI0037945217
MGVAGRVTAVVVAAGAVVTAGAVVAVPMARDWAESRHRQQAAYDTGAAAKQDRVSVPRWLPDGATQVSYLMSTTGGDRLIRATVPGGTAPTECRAGRPDGPVNLSASWFPDEAVARADLRCGLYNVALIGDQLYGWQDDAVVVAARKAGTTIE